MSTIRGGMSGSSSPLAARRRPAYLRMLFGILVAYTLIIVLGDTRIGDPARVVLLAYLLWTAARLHSDRRWRKWALVLGTAAVVAVAAVATVGSRQVVSGVIGGSSVVLIGVSIAAIVSTLLLKLQVDAATVLGVLCIYLLFALLFASVHQVFAAIESNYLHGVAGRPSASDLLYFSVITLSTVGYGDISPATEVARAVCVVEALTGQLYLVSVVAGVVAGWRMADHNREPGEEYGREPGEDHSEDKPDE
jgi:voltage-gated potassium channel Kch